MSRARKMCAKLRAAFSREDGSSTIEFVILFPAFMSIFLMTVETGALMTRGVMLDRALDISMRELRLGTLSPMTVDALKTSICKHSVIIPNCENVLMLELTPISKATWMPPTSFTCVDRSANVQPVLAFTPGSKNEMMMVRACAVFDPFFPTSGLAAQMKLDKTGGYALVAMSAYVNEP